MFLYLEQLLPELDVVKQLVTHKKRVSPLAKCGLRLSFGKLESVGSAELSKARNSLFSAYLLFNPLSLI